jgi:hypothetical protein
MAEIDNWYEKLRNLDPDGNFPVFQQAVEKTAGLRWRNRGGGNSTQEEMQEDFRQACNEIGSKYEIPITIIFSRKK